MTTDRRSSSQRTKRQSSGREELCQTNYQYITPQAALNSQGALIILLKFRSDVILNKFSFHIIFATVLGNWMFIVNQVDSTRQLVRTETCA